MDVNASCTRLVTGASDNQLRVWELSTQAQEGKAGSAAAMAADGEEEEDSGEGGGAEADIVAVYMGSVARQGNGEMFRTGIRNMFFRLRVFRVLGVFLVFFKYTVHLGTLPRG